MYLKSLELYGFKSFPNKIKLEFNKGITAIVGPNGSGKSNILDAIRWVLGEQHVKSLRGYKMEDIIFSGTSDRKALGFAQVSIVIDNEKKIIPIDYSEITITRRIYRSGESEFKINNSQCRLKDIVSLFMDTGIGKDGYSIISQGKIEEIVSSKNEDKRLLFEEAIGIVKYKHRRQEALNKLEKEKENLLRIVDIILEIENQLKPLKIQSEKANIYLRLTEQLKILQINSFLLKLNLIEDKISKTNKKADDISFEILNYEKDKYKLEENIKKKKENIISYENNINLYNKDITDLRSKIEQNENDIILKTEQKNNILLTIDSLSKLKDKVEIELKKDDEKRNELENKTSIISNDIKKEKENLNKYEIEFNKIINTLDNSEIKIKKYNSRMIENLNISNKLNEKIHILEITHKQLIYKKDEIENSIKTNKQDFLKEKENNNIIKRNLSNIENNIVLEDKKIENLKIKKEELEKNFLTIKNDLYSIIKNKNESITKINLLKELKEDYEGYNKSVKCLLDFKKNNNLEGIIAPVGEIIKVEKKFEIAIESVLGQSIENIISNTEYDAKKAIQYLKNNNIGRITFLPLSSIKSRNLYKKDEIIKSKGVIGICKDIVKYDNKYENIISYLLGLVVLVDNIDNSINLNKKYNSTFKIVTLDGEILNIGGSISGGINKKSKNIFARSREIETLKVSIKNLELKETYINKEYINLDNIIKNIQIEFKTIEEKYNKYKLDQIYNTNILEESEQNLNNLKVNLDKLNKEYINLKKEIKIKEEEIEDTKTNIYNTNLELENINKILKKVNEYIPQYRDKRDIFIKNITDKKVKISILEENYKTIIDYIEDTNNKKNKNEELLNTYNIKIKKQYDLEEERSKEISNLKKIIEENKNLKLSKENNLSKFNLENNKEKELLEKDNINLKTVSEFLFLSKNEKLKLDIQLENLNEEKKELYNKMWEDYEVTLQQALCYEKLNLSLSEIKQKEENIKIEIKNLGNINVNSIQEYKTLKTRYDFLNKQKSDIEQTEEKLKDIIIKLTELMEKKFKSNFNIISKNFNEIFSKMFEGGEASLKLYNENNILESSVEIIAKPPGKILQNILLLSGGEKTLTAISLLFAILKMKASPFCILDEIEASLDDANVLRYSNYLKKFESNTQFILITHRKIIMEISNTLYGITMQEQGISKLISINLED